MQWIVIVVLLLIIGIVIYTGYYIFTAVMIRKKKLPFVSDNIDDTNNVLAPTAKVREAYRLKHLESFRKLPFETLIIKSFDNLNLYANFLKGENVKETVILVHGYKSSAENEFGGIVNVYLRRQCNILALENRAHGRSEGKYIGFSELDQYDIIAWVKKINELYPETSIFLHGVSMGGASVIHTCNKQMKNVKGIIEDCGFTSCRAITKAMMKKTFNLPYFPFGYVASIFALIISKVDFDKSDGLKEVKESKYPILFITGDKDNFVPSKMTIAMYKACNSPKKLLVVENAGHAAANVVDEEKYFREVEMFLNKYN